MSQKFITTKLEVVKHLFPGTVRQQHEWVKVHLMCGVRTNIVTAVEIRDKDASDTKLLPGLVDATAKILPSARFQLIRATEA